MAYKLQEHKNKVPHSTNEVGINSEQRNGTRKTDHGADFQCHYVKEQVHIYHLPCARCPTKFFTYSVIFNSHNPRRCSTLFISLLYK